jgi:hypothetical protein
LGCCATAYPTNAKTTSRPMSIDHLMLRFMADPPQKVSNTPPAALFLLPIQP